MLNRHILLRKMIKPEVALLCLITLLATVHVQAATILVPSQIASLQTAITQANDGDIIELAGGSYDAPSAGFRLENNAKMLTIRGASGATVYIDGGGSNNLLWFGYDTDYIGTRGAVVFDRVNFRNGYSATDGLAAGVSVLYGAHATFYQCTFSNNINQAINTGGGGAIIGGESTAFFIDATFSLNTAINEGAGLEVQSNSTVYVHNSTFDSNRTNIAGHRDSSGGGAIHVGDSKLRVSNSRFVNNQAGYVAGAIFAIGTYPENWTGGGTAPGANVIVSNSTFIGNFVARDSSNPYYLPTEGGAFHAEDMTNAYIYSSRFEQNYAMDGGAVNLYRATVEVHDSVFLGNKAIGGEAAGTKSLGGTFSVLSNDANDATTGPDATYNRPSGRLTVTNSYIQGVYGNTTIGADVGGCLYASGDYNRLIGQNGVLPDGTAATNRAVIRLWDVVFNDCDVASTGIGGSGQGGAIAGDLADLLLQNSMVINSDATGSNSFGGGIALFNQSTASMPGVTIAGNSAAGAGGGLFVVQGSHMTLSNCYLLNNEFSPGEPESGDVSYGAALFTQPYDAENMAVTGSVEDCTISKNIGLAIWDDDRLHGPSNEIVYNRNTIFADHFMNSVYTNKMDVLPGGTPNTMLNVAELNSLVVSRTDGTSTDKSPESNNSAPGSAPEVAKLMAVPSMVYSQNAAGDAAPPTKSYLAYAWSGAGSATLNSNPLAEKTGVSSVTVAGQQTLAAGGASSVATVSSATPASVSLSASPTSITGSASSTLSWTLGGTLLDGAIDQGMTITPSSGSASAMPAVTTTYNMLAVTEEGGAHDSAAVTVTSGPSPALTVTLDAIFLSAGGSTNLNYSADQGSNVFFESSLQPLTAATIGAAPGSTTEYTVQAVNGFGTTEQKATIHVDNGEWVIGKPTITQPTASEALISTGAVTFTWSSVPAASGYYLEVWDAATGQTMHCEEVGPFDNDSSAGKTWCPGLTKSLTLATSTQVTLPKGSYMLAVRACDKTVSNFQRCGSFATQLFEFQGAMQAPTVTLPTASQVIAVSGITFSWTSVSGAAGYALTIKNRLNNNTLFSGSLVGENSNSTLISLPDGQYTFAVQACTSSGFEASNCSADATRSFDVALTEPTGAPTISAPAASANLTSSTQTLSWSAVTKADDSLTLYYELIVEDIAGGTTALQISVYDPATSTIATLPSSTQYRMKVRACQAGCGPWSTPVDFAMTLLSVPSTAPTITSAVVTGNSLTAEWSSVTGADVYRFHAVQPAGGPGGSALTVAARQVSGTSVTVPVPAGDTNLVVQACTGDGCGPYSGAVLVSPSDANPSTPNLGTPLAGSYVDGPAVEFSWSRIPGDDGSNTTYRLFVQDLSLQSTALDVYTTNNFYAAYFKAEGARYDALVVANPGPSQIVGPASGFNVIGTSSTAPTMMQPAHNSSLTEGNIQLGWTPVPGATLYEYYVAILGESSATVRGVTPGRVVQVGLTAVGGADTVYSGIVRACPAGATCVAGSDTGWGAWSVYAGPGVTNFTVTP